ncbi:HpcH/HpaI aldolase/citrate lyase family protein [Microdochium trichocladiopsis]|uniref:HpcH/HpaI aldolase/citrate lyase family protein n=1 Tax=Microdochium trichocladiopsis TaxID=1682393 RepID=A0A9P9BKB0_9PEZI|nr:HpcH/HpaI aldolase/citrate lyase family protein [Microdochium trichocladiopsis]KAH7026454.1 HpcH/HpaI aldolase/citrate lyase family protein [Microdochium trichocladiopsis]
MPPPALLQGCKLREAFARDQGASLGLWQCLPGANVSRTLARAEGVDWVLVDCEHGNIDDAAMHDAVPAIAACGPSPIVRIPDMQGWMIKRALDAGAHGVLVPLLRTVDEAKSVVAAAKFPPQGRRGLGSPFSMERFTPVPTMTEYLQRANDSLLTMVQIETAEALEAVDEIAAVPGIDVLFIGPFDLGNNIGFPILDGVMQPQLDNAIERVFEAAKKAGKKCGVFTTSTEQARVYAEKGYHMISIGLDVSILQAALPGRVEAVRGTTASGGKGGYYG